MAVETTTPVLRAELAWAARDFSLTADLCIDAPVTGVLGPSGAGKSTLLDLIAGLRRGACGHLAVGGTTLLDSARGFEVPPERRRIGYVFQHGCLLPHLSVRSNLLYGFRLLAPAQRRIGLARVVELLELGPLLHRRPHGLSGGERQRVALGRALLTTPHLLLLDEPLAALDEGRKRAILPFLGRIHAELGVPLLYVSHAVSEVLALTNRVVLLDAGKVVAYGDLFEVLRDEHAFEVATALGLENLLEVVVSGCDGPGGVVFAQLGSHRLTLPWADDYAPGTRAVVGVRPEDIILAEPAARTGISVQNAVRGVVRDLTIVRGRVIVHVDVGQPLRAEVTQRAAAQLGLRPGCPIACLMKTYALRWVSVRATRLGAATLV